MPLTVRVANRNYNFQEIGSTDLSSFEKPGFTQAIYKANIDDLYREREKGTIKDEEQRETRGELFIHNWSLLRVLKLQVALSRYFIGYDRQIQMLLACAIAQEPILFIGRPGVAKTEMALSFFNGIGLCKPQSERENESLNKFFEYLLSPFTVPEELFGTLDFNALEKKGTVKRINTNMATGPLVRGIFLDEIFNASSNILNTLLGLINERRYFDEGRFKAADLKVFIGASNMTPVASFGGSDPVSGKVSNELAAFYDRFTVRLYFPTPQEKYGGLREVMKEYELISKIGYERYMEKVTLEVPKSFPQVTCINDILLLGRILTKVEFPDELKELTNMVVANLAIERPERRLCHMSPRKPNKLTSVILANSLLLDIEKMRKDYIRKHGNDEQFYESELSIKKLLEIISRKKYKVKKEDLRIFHHIWDFEGDRERLKEEVDLLLELR